MASMGFSHVLHVFSSLAPVIIVVSKRAPGAHVSGAAARGESPGPCVLPQEVCVPFTCLSRPLLKPFMFLPNFTISDDAVGTGQAQGTPHL